MKQFGFLLCVLFSFFVAAIVKVEAKIETLLERGVKFNRGDISIATTNNVYLKLEYDCNLVLKKGTPESQGKTIWSSKTTVQPNNKDDTNCYAQLQDDGNLVIYKYLTRMENDQNNDKTTTTTTESIYSTTKSAAAVAEVSTGGESKNYNLVVDSNERLIILKDHLVNDGGECIEYWSNIPSYETTVKQPVNTPPTTSEYNLQFLKDYIVSAVEPFIDPNDVDWYYKKLKFILIGLKNIFFIIIILMIIIITSILIMIY